MAESKRSIELENHSRINFLHSDVAKKVRGTSPFVNGHLHDDVYGTLWQSWLEYRKIENRRRPISGMPLYIRPNKDKCIRIGGRFAEALEEFRKLLKARNFRGIQGY